MRSRSRHHHATRSIDSNQLQNLLHAVSGAARAGCFQGDCRRMAGSIRGLLGPRFGFQVSGSPFRARGGTRSLLSTKTCLFNANSISNYHDLRRTGVFSTCCANPSPGSDRVFNLIGNLSEQKQVPGFGVTVPRARWDAIADASVHPGAACRN